MYKNFISSQRLPTLRPVVHLAWVVKWNKLEEQKGREAQAKAKFDNNAKRKNHLQPKEQGKAKAGNKEASEDWSKLEALL